MRCKDVRTKIEAYVDGEIIDGSDMEIAAHVAACDNCARLYGKLVFSRPYLAKLKGLHDGNVIPNPRCAFEPGKKPAGLVTVVSAFLLIAGALGAFYYFFSKVPASGRFTQKPVGVIAGDSGFFMRMDGVRPSPGLLPEKTRVRFKTSRPTLAKAADFSWISVDGDAELYKEGERLDMDLAGGSVYFVFDSPKAPAVSINAAGFNVLSAHTAFYLSLSGGRLEIELLSGELLVKYRQGSTLAMARLSAGEGATGAAVNDREGALRVYKLSEPQSSELAMKIYHIRNIGRWAENNRSGANPESSDMIIEFWKGE